jgi:hypothetical protein
MFSRQLSVIRQSRLVGTAQRAVPTFPKPPSLTDYNCQVISLAIARETLIVSQSMRILVQDSARKVYFDGVDWNVSAADAKDFESVTQAEAFCQEHQLFTALIVVKSKDGSHDVSYPVGDRNAVMVSRPPTTRIKSLY